MKPLEKLISKEKLKHIVDGSCSLREAMVLIEINKHHSLIVVALDARVIGTISDGDIRRALLNGCSMEARVREVMNTNFIALRDSQRIQAQDLFDLHRIFLIPVTDDKGILLDVLESY